MRENYFWSNDDHDFSVELVIKNILELKRGKAAGLDSFTAEHLVCCHPSLSCILSKLFNLMLRHGYLSHDFGRSYIVPLYGANDCHTESALCSDFRRIAISCILSEVLEHCIINRLNEFFITNDNHFGFNKTQVAFRSSIPLETW
jgi:hypothetical protein